MKDYYETLEVDRTVDFNDIRKAYKLQAQKLHPDKGGNTERFNELQEAYFVLKDPELRAKYDRGEKVDLNGKPSLHVRATAEIMNAFQLWLNAVLDGKVAEYYCLTEITNMLKSANTRAAQAIGALESKLKKLDKLIGKFERDDEEYNYLEGQISQVRDKLQNELQSVTEGKAALDIALAEIDHYSYTPEEGLLPRDGTVYYTPTSASSTWS